MGNGNILFIDNDPLFLETRSLFLERAGYTVYQANTLSEAAKMLKEHWIQLIISDVRARDDDDIHDKTGIDFIQRPEYLKIPKIILTGMPNAKDTRNMLLPQIERDNQPIALNYIDKADGTDEMMLVVDSIFEDYIAVNQQLEIDWSDINLLELLGKIEEDFNPADLHERLTELEGLLRALLRGYAKATISQILIDLKQAPRLLAYVWTEQGTNKKYFIEIGKSSKIDDMHHRYIQAKALTRFEDAKNYTELALYESTPRYGAIAWSLRGFGHNQFLATFDQAIKSCSEPELIELIHDLYRHTISPWQGLSTDEASIKIQHLFDAVRPPQQLFEQVLTRAKFVAGYSEKVGMEYLDISPAGDINLCCEGVLEESHTFDGLCQMIDYIAEAAVEHTLTRGVTHGNLNLNTIFFNHSGQAWLTGFDRSETADYRLVESVRFGQNLRFGWSRFISPSNWLILEKAVIDPQELDAVENSSLKKMAIVLREIQFQAEVNEQISSNTFLEGLFWGNIAKIVALDIDDQVRGCHDVQWIINLLITTLVVGQKLLQGGAHSPLSLTLDHQNQAVVIDSMAINLTELEHKLLSFLAENPNIAVSRSQIAQAVFDVEYDDSESQDDKNIMDYNRITMTMSRLRKKIQPAVDDDYEFITAVRGRGYRLNL